MKLTLVKKIEEAKNTKSFYFKSDEKISWIPGQYIYITLSTLNYPDERGATRHFTISSSPTEGDLIQVTTRIREASGYKKTLDELSVGSVVEARGPMGSFVLTNHYSPITNHLFLAGGIGITPFRSMIKYNIDKGLNIPMYLIYSNSDSDFTFKKELDEWQKENKNIKVTYFNSSVSGHLDAQKLNILISDHFISSVFWVVGPNIFIDAMEEILEELKISNDQIKTEKFTGY
ncbi:MAG: Xylene monooxygenase electron transfer component-like protein [Candidatus Woesebacteria bacterium GW2011_GWA1_33_30]|uniref:Xylene monooxygenase electron transfer component-like protein n=1 Tax=Candidatus Woesebacteria bacterium GW2011_GWA2_33_28 TaxID=1618561 RepID=A0A0F9ZS15_9BACT|nr:MAG: Xylene monooxygenase electron transfer component-like protein [Candidatus Woesebacteria bacterium GW2011_GWA2_33_28]KKP47891.1 MAG: Xylene monooxygenase electron transfer component-like protein [Candidatus Woesebacteria bacterium GW2011_GWA1_33_30]KKP49333.1 MAG: Oxidoreductase FAD/NAD(P)-binding domain protein [Microgenomates group bacterium GW2011_GWC1_33_32]KKP52044.1 MAG: Xylene monooxygenase electron transfer component-like protein [Candidatus Woesebacteria bacterium GW2011_GWB1_33_